MTRRPRLHCCWLAALLVVLCACGDDDSGAGVIGGNRADSDASTDAGGDGPVGNGSDAGNFGFDDFGHDQVETPDLEVPAGWLCNPELALDAVCDCGCGNLDGICEPTGCAPGECWVPACDACFDEAGERVDCACVDADGVAVECEAPAAGYRCAGATKSDGVCDCGCGEADPDCAGLGCSELGCEEPACDVCHDAFGRVVLCAGQWSCQVGSFLDGTLCDCGCGAPDPDCGGKGCSEPGCQADACDLSYDGDHKPIVLDDWTCDPASFNALDGCHCGCGAVDPDCLEAQGAAERGYCGERGCRADFCNFCLDDAGQPVDCTWRCDAAQLGDGVCDCGCGNLDPDCANQGCTQPGCYANACETCFQGPGEESTCLRSLCPGTFDEDNLCDCGCRGRDPACLGKQCLLPGCSEEACAVCHDADGQVIQCAGWACAFERQGDGVCNCGCGLPDPDCGYGNGCAEPGCFEASCATCRAQDGSGVVCGQ